MRRSPPRLLPLLLAATFAGCENEVPTAIDEDLVPIGPVTVEVRLPWSQFAANLRVLGGFGGPGEAGRGFLANDFEGTLDARTLFHLGAFPTEVTVRDTAGTNVTDTKLAFTSAALVLHLHTSASTNTGPVAVSAGRTLMPWDPRSADWENAVDTLGVRTPWGEPGGGPVAPLGSAVWNRTASDSLLIPIDSATLAALGDTASDRGVRLELATPGERLEIVGLALRINARPSVRPDTVVVLTVSPADLTFIYTPEPPPPTEGLRVGGVPAWRSILDLALPATVPGTPQACARVACPLSVTPERITHAGLVLTTRPTAPAFRPTDSLAIEGRAVLAPQVLPKSPLGDPLFVGQLGQTIGATVPALGFLPGSPRTVELAITPFVQALVRGTTPRGEPAGPTLALLSLNCPEGLGSCFESRSLSYASFVGPGEPGEPVLRLLLTVSDQLELP